jgi:hypothetical protein
MRFVTSLSLQFSQLKPLVVVVAEAVVDNVLQLIAYGVDPSQDPNSEQFVFIRRVLDLGAFLKSVVDSGGQAQRFAFDDEGAVPFGDVAVTPNSIDVPVKPPSTPWPQALVVIALARSVTTDEQLANSGPTA